MVSKGRHKWWNNAAKTSLHRSSKKCLWKISKTFFAIRTPVLCLQDMLCGGVKKEAFGNTKETLTLNVSPIFLILFDTQATYDEEAESVSQKREMFCFLVVFPPK